MIPKDKLHEKLGIRAAKAVAKVKDIRRQKITPVPTGQMNRVKSGLEGTLFPNMVRDATPDQVVLKGGENVGKLGGVVLVGPLKGARLVSLALEERKTCPRSCPIWDGCMTNSMPNVVRYRHGRMLEAKILAETFVLCRENEKVLVRLHLTGDFYSAAYLQFWADLLDDFPNLHIFGFSAWAEDTDIGKGIAWLRGVAPDRFAVRTSGRTGKWGSFSINFPATRPMIGDAAVCPEQMDAMVGHQKLTHCGACGLCWKTGGAATGRPIVFVEH